MIVLAIICKIGGNPEPDIAIVAIICLATSSILEKLEEK